jgi:diketogulonate reductase-like aldo/keto reductase
MSSQSDQIPRLSLRPSESIPQLGFGVFDFQLSDAEMEAIKGLDAGKRLGPDPDTFVRP